MKFALQGMKLHGLLEGLQDGVMTFQDTLKESLDQADRVYNGINAAIDRHIAQQGLDAPPPSVYEPVWQPLASVDHTRLDLAAAGHDVQIAHTEKRISKDIEQVL